MTAAVNSTTNPSPVRAHPMDKTTPIEKATDDVSAQMAALRDDFAGVVKAVGNLATTGAEEAKGAAMASTENVRAIGAKQAEIAQNAISQQGEELMKYTKQKPFTALAIAAGVGVAIGMLSAARKR